MIENSIFLNARNYPMYAVFYNNALNGLVKKHNKMYRDYELPHITPHVLRHTFCTNMANARMTPNNLQYIMGHANIVMTLNYYAHATFHSAQEEMERLQAQAQTSATVNTQPASESAQEAQAA